jgi:hypothetical protein
MPKILCHYLDCLFLDERYCSAAAIELNPDTGCQTYTLMKNRTWKLGEEEELDDWEAMGTPDELSGDWDDDDDDDDDLDDDPDSF